MGRGIARVGSGEYDARGKVGSILLDPAVEARGRNLAGQVDVRNHSIHKIAAENNYRVFGCASHFYRSTAGNQDFLFQQQKSFLLINQ